MHQLTSLVMALFGTYLSHIMLYAFLFSSYLAANVVFGFRALVRRFFHLSTMGHQIKGEKKISVILNPLQVTFITFFYSCLFSTLNRMFTI